MGQPRLWAMLMSEKGGRPRAEAAKPQACKGVGDPGKQEQEVVGALKVNRLSTEVSWGFVLRLCGQARAIKGA